MTLRLVSLRLLITFTLMSLPLLSSPVNADAPVVTLKSLLGEMVDRNALARWPSPSFTVRQASSYDRSRVAPDKPGWFGNNDSSNYVRTETVGGHEERVMLDADGAGAIVRFFFTNGGPANARIRIYLDGASRPTLEWPTSDLGDGALKVDAPLLAAHPEPVGHGGATLYLPIPYARHCKVTLEEPDPAHATNRYYHIEYRTYAPGTVVESFAPAGLDAARSEVERVNRLLANPTMPTAGEKSETVGFAQMLAGGAEASVDLPGGPHAVRELELTVAADLPPAAREQALRAVVLRASFDDDSDAIWCPVGDFAGSGAGGHPLAGWMRTVDARGNAVCRWTMPYRDRSRLTLQNLGASPVKVRLSARVGAWTWDDRSLRFHANWHQERRIPARPYRDWNFVTITGGRGVLVGDVMSVYNPLRSWYGEGDEKIWVDDEAFPSHVGTGTEDYYNASWAPNPVYQTPFASHPRIDDPLSQGQNVYTRTRSLDAIPFTGALRFDFEIMTWKDSAIDYAATTYWYGAPGARSVLGPQPDEALAPILRLPPRWAIKGAIECETLPIVARSPGLIVEPQDMRWATGVWSDGFHLLVRGKQVGDFVELEIPVADNRPKRLTLYATRAFDYGILRFSVNGRPIKDTFDGYAPDPSVSDPIPLGVFTPQAGKLRLRVELVGTNPHSGGFHYLAGLDAVTVSDE